MLASTFGPNSMRRTKIVHLLDTLVVVRQYRLTCTDDNNDRANEKDALHSMHVLHWYDKKKTSSVWRSRENLTTIFMYVFFLLISIKHFTGREKNQRTSMYYVCFCVDLAMLVDDANLKYKLNNLQLV